MSSCNYNQMLSPYEDKGTVGKPEIFDTPVEVEGKTDDLYGYIINSDGIVIVTGAGISTAAGIPDFRGPQGVWTLEKAGKVAGGIDILNAQPTYAHKFLVELEKRGKVAWLITQNIDGMHRKSGFPVEKTSELHGNVTKERCSRCKRVVYRDFLIPSVGFQPTGRMCEQNERGRPCRGHFIDTTLDWNSELPRDELNKCYEMLQKCELLLCLGTSLEILPVGDFPAIVAQNGGAVVSINLQETKHEATMKLAIHARLDDVCRILCDKMEMYIEEPVHAPVLHQQPSSSKRVLEDPDTANSVKKAKMGDVDKVVSVDDETGVGQNTNGDKEDQETSAMKNGGAATEIEKPVPDVIELSDDEDEDGNVGKA